MAVLKNVTCMNPGDGKTSYANNSGLQKAVTLEALPVVDETLKEMLADGCWRSLRIVDLGCSSGPNTIFIISHIVDTIQHLNINNPDQPEIEVFLNDLPDNDFNNLFKLLQCFINQPSRKETISRCFVYGLPGSFHGTLFPNNTIHFAYSSYSLHWLSQIPQGLKKNNKENIYIARTSPPEVFEAYAEQYRKDFSMFLKARGSEIVPGGRMVLTFVGRSVEDPSSEDNAAYLTLLSETLSDMVAEGLIKIDDLYSFNVPIYLPYIHEVEAIIQKEESFNLDKMQVFRVPWDAHHDDDSGGAFLEKYTRGKLVSDCVRAFMEPLLGSYFGSSVVDELFERYAERVAVHLTTEEGAYFTILISLSKKA